MQMFDVIICEFFVNIPRLFDVPKLLYMNVFVGMLQAIVTSSMNVYEASVICFHEVCVHTS